VSLNADTDEKYYNMCKPRFGGRTYAHILEFIKSCVANGIETEVTCLDLDGVDLKKCEATARESGAAFRLRKTGIVG
jgi:TatD DNase family protein